MMVEKNTFINNIPIKYIFKIKFIFTQKQMY